MADEPRDLAKALEDLFGGLVPPKDVEIEDIGGHVYRVPGALPARAQIEVTRKLRAILESETTQGAGSALGSLPAEMGVGSITALLVAAIDVAADPAVQGHLAAAFEAAHPKVLAAARGACEQPGADALDLFPIEDVVAALVPFALRAVSRLRAVAGSLRSPPAR